MGARSRSDRLMRSPFGPSAGVAVAGVAGLVVDTTILWTASHGLGVPVEVAAAAGFLASGLVNFVVNRWFFSAPGGRTGRQSLRYAVLFAVNLAIVTVTVPLLSSFFSTHERELPAPLIVAKLCVTAVLLPVNAICYRRWVFSS